MTLDQRLTLITAHAEEFTPFTGSFTRAELAQTYAAQIPHTAILPETILHIISGNTPHAAYQSLLHGLLLGSKNLLKLPSRALLDFQIPPALAPFVEVSRTLPDHWITSADALVVFGSDTTLRHFQSLCPLEIPFIGHGQRLGIALIDDPSPEAARLAARDIGLFNQQGCLSLQTIFVKDPRDFAPLLATAMADFENENPRGPLSPSEAGAITNLREETRYLIAQDPIKNALWESPSSTGTAWTIIYQDLPPSSDLTLSPGNRCVFLRPLAPNLTFPKFLSGIALHPYHSHHSHQERANLPSPRIFPLGEAQFPPALWPHDGILPLSALIRHQTSSP